MSHKYKDIDYTKIAHDLENNGYTIIENYIEINILKNANQILLDNFNYDFEKKRQYAGFKMGNLAINECYIHQKIYQELIDLIVFLKKKI